MTEHGQRAGGRDAGRLLAGAALGVALMGGVVLDAGAHEGARGIVKERMDLMSDMGDANEVIGDMIKGKRELDPEEINALARRMGEHARRIPELFPDTGESREGAQTEALPAIWKQWSEFEALARELERESAALAETAAGAQAALIRKQFVAVTRTCRSCHTDFREKKDE